MRELENLIQQFSNDNLQSLLRSKTRNFRLIESPLSEFDDEQFSDTTLFGEFKINESEEMVVVTAKVNKKLIERSGKKAQYTLGKKFLKSNDRYAGGFFIFYDDKGDFRFSLIYNIPLPTGKRDWSNFRRYTYFVSKDQTNKTFIKQFSEAEFTTLEKIIDAFSVEKVTKEFYQEIANWYFWALKNVKFPDDAEAEKNGREIAVIRLITRLIFIWFMKVLKLVPEELFDEDVLKEILIDIKPKNDNYYKAILQNLFFATLNTKPEERRFTSKKKGYKGFSQDFGNHNVYRYEEQFKNSEEVIEKYFMPIPFLNGGLFECLDDKEPKVNDERKYIDGFTSTKRQQPMVPNFLFFGDEEEVNELNKDYGTTNKKYIVKGIINTLSIYNFTIDENTPIDQDVALDPELLGKVFENLLAAYVPETAITARKATGSYYTPPEIVEYMVNESLIAHFKTILKIDDAKTDENLRKLLDFSSDDNPFDEKTTLKLIDAIENIKILDPACGSGAFPMGVLHKLVLALHKLDPKNKIWKQKLLDRVPPEIRSETEKSLENKSIDYIRKLGLIEHCIYGVDIQEIAIQISKLRFFISLLVEQEIDDSKYNRDIRPLPNLETKFVAANTLIGLKRPSQMILTGNEVDELEKQLFKIREEIFYTNSRREKLELQKREKKLREELKTKLELNGFPNDVAEKITNWDPFDQNTHADWFDPEWMFGIKLNESSSSRDNSGFDIVIGNPPYIQLQKAFNDKIKYADLYKDQNYKTFERTGDIYCLFYEKGIDLLRSKAHLCYITSNKWMRAGYGESLRNYFSNYNLKLLIDLGPNVFENATVDTNILLIQKSDNENKLRAVTINENKKDRIDFNLILKEKGVQLNKLGKDAWFIGSDTEHKLKEKIERIGKPLKDWDVNIYYGIKTGLNEAFIITTEKRNEILANCKTKEERKRTESIIKPILRGRDIKRYYYEWAGLWVIGTFPALRLNIEDYPAIKKYFLDNFDIRQLEQSGKKYPKLGFDARKKTGNKWFETQDQIAYYPEFEKEKVVWAETDQALNTVIVPPEMYLQKTCFMIIYKRPKIINALLNSKIIQWYIRNLSSNLGKKGLSLTKDSVQEIPLLDIILTNKFTVQQIETLVDKILSVKIENKNADTSEWEREIDGLVYKLYDLTEDEIKIIEGGNRGQ